jgi:Fe-S-cluster-containing hydrogenase component 2
MENTIAYQGCPTLKEIEETCGYPSAERFKKGPVVVVECVQEIPCDPCQDACPFEAIIVGDPITNLPVTDYDKCTGCGKCVAFCPGLAIFIVNKAFAPGEATIAFPHEYLPLPKKDDIVKAVNRKGEIVCDARVRLVNTASANVGTAIITLIVPLEHADDVRGMVRLKKG